MINNPNPALEPLAVLVGDWEMEISNASFLPSPSETMRGQASFEWVEDGAYLVIRMGDKASGTPSATWLIGRDDSAADYTILYYDSRRVSRVYQMSLAGNVWKMWRESPGFSQRYEGRVSPDRNTITARWEKSSDGRTWEHDFDLTYTRVAKDVRPGPGG